MSPVVDGQWAIKHTVPGNLGLPSHEGGSLEFKFASVGINPEPEELYARFYIWFTDSWYEESEPDLHVGKLPGFSGTYDRCGWGNRSSNPAHGRQDAGTCWSARLYNEDVVGRTAHRVGFYVYHMNQQNIFGDSLEKWPTVFQNNQWYCIEQRVKMNTVGIANGILEGWVDAGVNDQPVYSKTDLRFRNVSTAKIEKLWWNIFVGGGDSYQADHTMNLNFDNAVISTTRIGCPAAPPPPPTCPTSAADPAGTGDPDLWVNQAFTQQTQAFTAQFDVTPDLNGILARPDAVTGLSLGTADAWTDLAAIVRFNEQGLIDARNGSTYQAREPITYADGTTYPVRMVVNRPARKYSVYVTRPGESEKAVGIDYAFRTEQSAVTALNNLALAPDHTGGTHKACGLAVTPCQLSSASWQNSAFTSQSGTFTARFNVIPNAKPIDGVTGLSLGAADAYTDLAAIVRFNLAGTVDARNGGVYQTDLVPAMQYVAGGTYGVRLVVNVLAHTYSVYVTPPDGIERAVGANYAFRTEQNGVTSLSNVALAPQEGGTHNVCSFRLQ
jgi:hypothetical protein